MKLQLFCANILLIEGVDSVKSTKSNFLPFFVKNLHIVCEN